MTAPVPVSPTGSFDGSVDMTAIIQSHPVVTFLLSTQGRVLDVNQAAENLFNRGRTALIGQSVDQLFHSNSRSNLSGMLADPGKNLWAYAIELQRAGGEVIVADIAVASAGRNSEWRVLAIHPVPRAGRMPFRRPGSAGRSAGAAAAMLAHEIKNPLSGIRGAAQLLGKANRPGNPAELAALIVGEVDRIAKLIDSMQGFTRDAIQPSQPINIYPAIAQAKGIAQQGFGQNIHFVEEFDPSLPMVMGHHDSLVQILINLIKNASEAVGNVPNAKVRLMTAYRHGLSWDAGDGGGHRPLPVEICVADNGAGVDDALVESMFDPFVSSKREGQGLGLALVDKLARDMGGLVQYDRTGGWTRFRVHLPAQDSGAQGMTA